MSATPGWYQDPNVPGQLRFFDGANWTGNVQPDPTNLTIQQVAPPPVASPYQAPYGQPAAPYYQPVQQVQVNQINMIPQPQKSVGVALLLTFFFGPFGMFYSTVAGGVTMTLLTFTLGILFFPFLLLFWPIEMIWAAVAASKSKQPPAMMSVGSTTPMAQPMAHPQSPAGWQPSAPAPPPAAPQAPGPYPGAPTGTMPALPQSTGPNGWVAPPPVAELPTHQPGQSSNWYD